MNYKALSVSEVSKSASSYPEPWRGLDADKLDDELSEVCPKTDFGYLVLKSAKVNLRKAVERVERPCGSQQPY